MRIPHIIIGAALTAAFVIGCKRSSPSHLPAGTKDLGVIEFTEGTPQQFSLGGGIGCTATAKRIDGDNIEVHYAIVSTNADGTVSDFCRPVISTSRGGQCLIPLADLSIDSVPKSKIIALTPKWKTP
jgi:hypothetical protein